jgi:Flp pilus assembly protein TadG
MLRARIGSGEAERGSAMVEFAIASTVALTLIFGIIDFGRALYTYHLVSNAARLGSRYAMVRGSACAASGCPTDANQIQTYVRSLAPGVDPSVLAVATSWSPTPGCVSAGNNGQGCLVTVQVTYPFSFIVPLMPNLKLPLTSASTMVISQ